MRLGTPTNAQNHVLTRIEGYREKAAPHMNHQSRLCVINFVLHAVRLYEQERGRSLSTPPLLGLYVRRWVSWVNAGL